MIHVAAGHKSPTMHLLLCIITLLWPHWLQNKLNGCVLILSIHVYISHYELLRGMHDSIRQSIRLRRFGLPPRICGASPLIAHQLHAYMPHSPTTSCLHMLEIWILHACQRCFGKLALINIRDQDMANYILAAMSVQRCVAHCV